MFNSKYKPVLLQELGDECLGKYPVITGVLSIYSTLPIVLVIIS